MFFQVLESPFSLVEAQIVEKHDHIEKDTFDNPGI